jgi:hypothetical protein
MPYCPTVVFLAWEIAYSRCRGKLSKLDTANKRFTLNATKERLKNAPGFDKDHWPAMADTTWASDVHKFYGVKTTGKIQ